MSFFKKFINIATDKREVKEPVTYKGYNDNSPILNEQDQLLNSDNSTIGFL